MNIQQKCLSVSLSLCLSVCLTSKTFAQECSTPENTHNNTNIHKNYKIKIDDLFDDGLGIQWFRQFCVTL